MADYVEATKAAFEGLVDRPPLTNQFLEKPPLRFIHDLFTETQKKTGIFPNLLTDDIAKSEKLKSKEAKLKFMEFLIAAVEFGSAEKLEVKAAKALAGMEPEKTNRLLQCLGETARRVEDIDHVNIVEKVHAGVRFDGATGSAGSNKENRRKSLTTEEPVPAAEKKSSKPEKSDRKKSKDRDKDKKSSSEKKDKKEHRSSSKTEKDSKEKDSSSKTEKEKDPEKKHRSSSKHKESKSDDKDKEHKSRDKDEKHKSKDKDDKHKEKSRRKDKDEKKEKHRSKESSHGQANGHLPSGDQNKTNSSVEPAATDTSIHNDDPDMEHTIRAQSPPRPGTSLGRPGTSMGRPGTAARRAPRLKRRELPEQKQAQTVVLEGAEAPLPDNVITAHKEDNKAEDDFLVDETLEDGNQQNLFGEGLSTNLTEQDLLDASDHGGLVQKLLATKKELDTDQDNEQRVTTVVFDEQERNKTRVEIEKIKGAVQGLTRLTHPLARLLDYMQEDIDGMLKENEQWMLEYKQNIAKLHQLRAANQGKDTIAIHLQSKIAELENEISSTHESIAAVRSKIIQNEEQLDSFIRKVAR